MDISKYNKADVLRVLYNNANVVGMGVFSAKRGDMTKEQAEELLKEETYFGYVCGRVLKVDLSTNDLNTRLYNRDNGYNAAECAVLALDTHENYK